MSVSCTHVIYCLYCTCIISSCLRTLCRTISNFIPFLLSLQTILGSFKMLILVNVYTYTECIPGFLHRNYLLYKILTFRQQCCCLCCSYSDEGSDTAAETSGFCIINNSCVGILGYIQYTYSYRPTMTNSLSKLVNVVLSSLSKLCVIDVKDFGLGTKSCSLCISMSLSLISH